MSKWSITLKKIHQLPVQDFEMWIYLGTVYDYVWSRVSWLHLWQIDKFVFSSQSLFNHLGLEFWYTLIYLLYFLPCTRVLEPNPDHVHNILPLVNEVRMDAVTSLVNSPTRHVQIDYVILKITWALEVSHNSFGSILGIPPTADAFPRHGSFWTLETTEEPFLISKINEIRLGWAVPSRAVEEGRPWESLSWSTPIDRAWAYLRIGLFMMECEG